MTVNLISYTQPIQSLQDQGILTLTDLIAYTARVSNPDNQFNKETSDKLIQYLIRHKHWSPFETVSVTLEIKTTRDIARQILRHKSFSFQEFSQRYAKVNTNLSCREARLQDTKNRQNSISTDDVILQQQWVNYQQSLIDKAISTYNWALENGIAKEQARVVLPEGLTNTTLYMAGTVRSWIHYCQLRCANGTQLEHQQVALDCAINIAEVFPSMKQIIEG